MSFFHTLGGVLLGGLESPGSFTVVSTLALFLFSISLLLTGIAVKVWSDALNLSAIERKPLKWIEQTHPHLPSLRVLLTFSLCLLALLAVGLQTLRGVFPFNDPYQGVNLITLFSLAAALGIIGELKWRGAKTYAYAFLLGTALGFLALTLIFADPPKPFGERLVIGSLTLLVTAGAWSSLGEEANRKTIGLLAAVICALWVGVYLA